jgi:hypothetical protein
MSSKKERWTKPQLIVLSRGTADESVLLHCKRIGHDVGEADPQSVGQTGCDYYQDPADPQQNCGACQSRSGT